MEITPIQEKEIRVFETVLANTEKIIPFDRFYVALYDRRNASLYYPIVRLEDKSCLKLPDLAEGPWAPRPFAPDNQWPDCLWRSEVDVPNGSNPQSWLAERKLWHKDEKDEQRIGLNYHLAPYPRSWLIAPLKARGGAVMGVLVAEDLHREGAYGADLQTWFATATNRVAGTLSSLRLVESLRTVNRVGQRLTAGARQSVADILELLHSEAGQLMDTRDMFVALYDVGRQQLSFPLAYFNGEPQNWEARTVVIGDKPGGGLTEEVIRKPGTLCPPDVEKWYKDNKIKPRVLPVPKSWLGMPLLSGERVLGVIALQNDEVERLYSADDQEILEAMANQVSAELANAQLVERLQAVNEVGQRLTSGTRLGEGEILQLIYEQAGKLMDTRDMFVAFYNAAKQELSFPLFYIDGKSEKWPSRPVNLEDPLQRKLTEEVLYHRQLLNVPNFSQWFEERWRPVPAEPPKSWLGVPLMVEDRVLGVIALQNDEIEGLYGPDDEAVLQAMASQAATALENARLLEQERQLLEQERQLLEQERQLREQEQQLREQEQRKSEQLATLQDIGVKLTAELDLVEVLSAIAESANQVISADFSTLFLYDPEHEHFLSGIRRGKIDKPPSLPSSNGHTAQLAKTQESVFVQVAESEISGKTSFATTKDVKSYAGIPLVIKGKTVGVLFVNFLVYHVFQEDEKRTLQSLANQAAVAIENAQLFEDLGKAQSRIAESESILVRSGIATDFVHRTNNLVGTIPIWLDQIRETLEKSGVVSPHVHFCLEHIDSDVDDILRAAENLKKVPQAEIVSLGEILRPLVSQVRIQTSASIGIEIVIADEEQYWVKAVPSELTNAFWSIIENGIDAMPEGGNLAIMVTRLEVIESVEIKIKDEGLGIMPDDFERVFLPFYSTKVDHMGYGLWRAKDVIQGIGGDITFESALGEGTTFIVKLPLEFPEG
jgi:GAF domain-containing protein